MEKRKRRKIKALSMAVFLFVCVWALFGKPLSDYIYNSLAKSNEIQEEVSSDKTTGIYDVNEPALEGLITELSENTGAGESEEAHFDAVCGTNQITPITLIEKPVEVKVPDNLYIIVTGANVREKNSQESKRIGGLKIGELVEINSVDSGGWAEITYKGKIGYIRASCAEKASLDDIADNEDLAIIESTVQTEDVIVVDGTVAENRINKIKDAYNKLPQHIKELFVNQGWNICISEQHIKDIYEIEVPVVGFVSDDDRTIHINNDNVSIENALYHEIGHFVDIVCGYLSNSEDFLFLYETEGKTYEDNYGLEIKNAEEYFASIFNLVMLDVEKANELMPVTSAYIEKYVIRVAE